MSVSFKRIVQATALAVPLVVISPQLPAMAADTHPMVAQAQCEQSTNADSAMQHCVKNAADLLGEANKHEQGTPSATAEQPTPGADKPAADPAPAADKPAADKPAADKPAADKPAADPAPATDKPAADKPAADKPAADKPAADKPAADKPAADKPAPDAGKGAKAAPAPAVSQQQTNVPFCMTEAEVGESIPFHLDACQLLDQLGVIELLQTLGIDLNQLPIDLHHLLELKTLLEKMGIFQLLQMLPIGKLISGLGIVQLLGTVLAVVLSLVPGASFLLGPVPGAPKTPAP